ncbi:MAG TPA: histidine phosphatase family protein [Mycobacteriales bacterium]|nr:histidine phosphatase family protein [Mycobacteriales bacterium]
MTRTVVNLVRHGEVANPTGVLYGRLPGFRLSPAGEHMAVLAAEALAGHDVRVIVSSPLERAVQTAEAIAERFGLPIRTDERLIESANAFEGMKFGVGDGALRKPANWRHLYNPFKPSWGEPYAIVAARVLGACSAARKAAEGGEAVLVSHQLPIWVTRRAVEGQRLWHRPDRRECALASITSFVYEDDEICDVDYQEPAGASGRSRVGGA